MDKKELDALESARRSRAGYSPAEIQFVVDALKVGKYDARDINKAGRLLGYFAGKSYDSVGNKIRRIQQEAKS